MLRACSEAMARGVAIGAAVGYADRIVGGERFIDYDPTLTIIGLPGSRLLQTAERHGLNVAREFQPHRLLNANGSLGPVITDPDVVTRRALEAAATGNYDCIRLPWHSIAERGTARAIHTALVEAGPRITGDRLAVVSDLPVLSVAPARTPA